MINTVQITKYIFLAAIILISGNAIHGMDKQWHQKQINNQAKQQLQKAGPTQQVSINPNAAFNLQLAATNHNVNASHNQFIQNQQRYNGKK